MDNKDFANVRSTEYAQEPKPVFYNFNILSLVSLWSSSDISTLIFTGSQDAPHIPFWSFLNPDFPFNRARHYHHFNSSRRFAQGNQEDYQGIKLLARHKISIEGRKDQGYWKAG